MTDSYQLVSQAEMKTLVAFLKTNEPIDPALETRLRTYGPSQRCVIGADLAVLLRDEITKGWKPNGGGPSNASVIAAGFVRVAPATLNRAMKIRRVDPKAFEGIYRGLATVESEYSRVYEQPVRAGKIEKLRPLPALRNAIAAKARMIRGLSQVRGLCSWLPEERAEVLHMILTPEEIETWAGIARAAAYQLDSFARRLEGKNGHD